MKKVVLITLLFFTFFTPLKCLTSKALERENVTINISVNGKLYVYDKCKNSYNGKNFVIKHNKQMREKQIAQMGKEKVISQLLACGKSEEQVVNYLLPNFENFLADIKGENDVPAINASAEFVNGEKVFTYTSDVMGSKIDSAALCLSVLNNLASGKSNIEVKAEFVKVEADVSLYDVKQMTKLRSCESTSYASSEEGRRHNLLKAMECFNGLVVKPGEKISFNKVTGEKSYDAGYKDAMVILNGEFVKGVGGGVCQASTTIYNAALMAGLEICEVRRHSLPVYYVPAGFDAMVSESSDMVFKNNTSSNIYFKTYSSGERVYAEVYGESMKGVSFKKLSTKVRDIETKSDIIKSDTEGKYADKITYKGEFYRVRSPRKGFEVNAYLQRYENGRFVSEKLIRNEIYAAQKGVVYEGCKEAEEGVVLRDYGVFDE